MLEYLEHYRPSALESAIVDFYKRNYIKNPQDINLEMFAYDAGIWFHYSSRPSNSFEWKTGYSVVIDNRLPWEQQRVEFAHELGHCLLHAGRQEFMINDLRVTQEWQADRFAAFALAPTYMIANCWVEASSREQLVNQLAYHFDVPEPFMDARLQVLKERMSTLAAEHQLAKAIQEMAASYDYTYRHPANNRIEYMVKDGDVVGRRLRSDL